MNYVLSLFRNSDSSEDPVEKVRITLKAVRQYQNDWKELGVNRVYKYFDNVDGNWLECSHYSLKIMNTASVDLNALNELNQLTAGKICFVKVADETLFPIYSVEEFKPDQHVLVIDQIWTYPQEILVRTLLEYLATDKENNLGEIVKYQEILIEWLSSNDGECEGILND